MLNQIKVWLRSDTVKTALAIFVLNGIQALFPIIPEWAVQVGNAILPLMAIYFRVKLKTAL